LNKRGGSKAIIPSKEEKVRASDGALDSNFGTTFCRNTNQIETEDLDSPEKSEYNRSECRVANDEIER
jgi:hypothetical protein